MLHYIAEDNLVINIPQKALANKASVEIKFSEIFWMV